MTTPDPFRPDRAAGAPSSAADVRQILHLAQGLAERVQASQAAGMPLLSDQVAALRNAGTVLREAGVAWPPALAAVLSALAEDAGVGVDGDAALVQAQPATTGWSCAAWGRIGTAWRIGVPS